jgi:hypothetical protein
MDDKIDRQLIIDRIKYEMDKLSKMRYTDKKYHDSILWMHIREMERRLLSDLQER